MNRREFNKAHRLGAYIMWAVLMGFWHGKAVAQTAQATKNLYICQGDDGVDQIVKQPINASCKPYHRSALKGAVSGKTSTTNAPVVQTTAQRSQTTTQQSTQNLGQSASNQAATAGNYGLNAANLAAAKSSRQAKIEVIKPLEFRPSNAPAVPEGAIRVPLSGVVPPDQPRSHSENAIQAEEYTPPAPDPIEAARAKLAELPPPTNISFASPHSKGESISTEGAPQDIYRCRNDEGATIFVGESEISAYQACQFYSRSYAKTKEKFKATINQNSASLTQLAQQGVNQTQTQAQGLQCVGAGTIRYQGKSHQLQCANRSYDHSKGSTGGQARLGTRQATVVAHNLDYLNTAGSCGGTITSETGKIFHLVPTKDCPAHIQIQARELTQAIEKQLNINTSGAFRQRQRALAAQINQIAREVGVDPYLVHAVISAESAYKREAKSHAGAMGLMQLMPATARRFSVSDPYHTGQNIRGGTTYLKWLLNHFNGNIELAIAGYNAGEGNVRKYGYKIPPFIETRAYVPKVLQYMRHYRKNPAEIGL